MLITPSTPVLISTHALTEGDNYICAELCVQWISTHALTEGDGQFHIHSFKKIIFQLTPSRRATPVSTVHPSRSTFQLTPSRRATVIMCAGRKSKAFQLTPSRRATICSCGVPDQMRISAHALTEGDRTRTMQTTIRKPFQLTPSRRATMMSGSTCTRAYFNSRPHGGRRLHGVRRSIYPRYFNSRPHGGRLVSFILPPLQSHFNSRPHGGRPEKSAGFIPRRIFQLTPSRRATFIGSSTSSKYVYFNSRPHGGRLCSLPKSAAPSYFNSRPHGGRPIFEALASDSEYFNSRPHGGRLADLALH